MRTSRKPRSLGNPQRSQEPGLAAKTLSAADVHSVASQSRTVDRELDFSAASGSIGLIKPTPECGRLYESLMKTLLLTSALLLCLAGCVARNASQQIANSGSLAWARNDGQLISGDAELTTRARSDISSCAAAIPPVRTRDGVLGEACMQQHGYHLREIPPATEISPVN
jgi:hypothetical protein